MTLTSKPLAALIVVLLFGGIFFSSIMGWFQTKSTKVAAIFSEGEFAGQANPADIRGSYTLGDVEKNFGISPSVLAQAFGINDPNPSAYAIKNLETLYESSPTEIGTIKDFCVEKGLSFETIKPLIQAEIDKIAP